MVYSRLKEMYLNQPWCTPGLKGHMFKISGGVLLIKEIDAFKSEVILFVVRGT